MAKTSSEVQKSKLFLVKAREVDPTTGGIQGAYAHPLGPFPSLTKCSTHRLKPPPPPLFIQEFVSGEGREGWGGGKLKQSSFPVVAVVVVVVVVVVSGYVIICLSLKFIFIFRFLQTPCWIFVGKRYVLSFSWLVTGNQGVQ